MNKYYLQLTVFLFLLVSGACFSYAAFPVASDAPAKSVSATISTTSNAEITAQMEEYSNAMGVARTPAPVVPDKGGNRSQFAALIFCILMGCWGFHRFYLGYTWQGIVQLLTFGGCGIWVIIDLVRIITGDLGPKNGRYDPTL